MIKTYEIHDFAGLVPLASDEEQEALNEDIKENGLREPVVLWQGKIVDGRCRQQACVYAGEKIRIKELDDNLTDEEVRITVKSLNARRNLTMTQKIMSACKVLLDANNSMSSKDLAKAWGISKAILDNAKYVAKQRADFIAPLFNGKAVTIIDSRGKEKLSNKISTIYASVKRMEENVDECTEHGWNPNSAINTQAGKDWFYNQTSNIDSNNTVLLHHLLIELANYKFSETAY